MVLAAVRLVFRNLLNQLCRQRILKAQSIGCFQFSRIKASEPDAQMNDDINFNNTSLPRFIKKGILLFCYWMTSKISPRRPVRTKLYRAQTLLLKTPVRTVVLNNTKFKTMIRWNTAMISESFISRNQLFCRVYMKFGYQDSDHEEKYILINGLFPTQTSCHFSGK